MIKIPEPLIEDVINHRSIPIIGAGFSKNARLPRGKVMPDWRELGRQLAQDLPGVDAGNPLEVISAYEHTFSRVKLAERLNTLLHVADALPGNAHRAFGALPFDVVCTTNVDPLLEDCYRMQHRPYFVIDDDEQLPLAIKSPDTTTLLKLHGDLARPKSMTLTEEDYDAFLVRHPLMTTYLSNLLITRTPVFIGYSLEDPDMRQIWQVVKERLGKLRRPAYALVLKEDANTNERWRRRGVTAVAI